MVNFKARAEALGRTQMEIQEEMAAALGRIGRALESLVAEMKALEQSLPASESRYVEVRKKARLYYWYLIVQREAIGLRNHRDVIRKYGIHFSQPPRS